MRTRLLGACGAIVVVALACRPTSGPQGGNGGPERREDASAVLDQSKPASDVDAAIAQVLAEAGASDGSTIADTDPMVNHKETREEILALFSIKDFTEQEKKVIQ